MKKPQPHRDPAAAPDGTADRLRILEQVLRNAAHDFSEAIMPILATCDLVQGDPDTLKEPDRVTESLVTIRLCASQCRQLARDLAGYCHPSTAAGGTTDGVAAIRQAVALVNATRAEPADGRVPAPIEIRVETAVLPPLFIPDWDLREALFNLLRNAIRAMPDGGTIFVSAAPEDESVLVSVRDTGHGMSKEQLERFRSPEGGGADAGKGTGLGMIRDLLQRHGGALTIDSDPCTGTLVTLKLPAQREPVSESRPTSARAPAKPASGRILIVDDDPMVRTVMSKVFRSKNHQVDVAADGAAALALLKEKGCDLVIVDRSMPGMSGDELAAAIRQAMPAMPIVMLTGYGDIMLREGDKPEHIDTVIPKTAPVDVLLATAQQAMAK